MRQDDDDHRTERNNEEDREDQREIEDAPEEEENYETNDQELYDRFHKYEEELGYGDMPDDYFDDAQAPNNYSKTKKVYTFSHHDASQDYYADANYQYRYNRSQGYPTQSKAQKKQPKQVSPSDQTKPGLIAVPKMNFTKNEKKKMDKLLKDMQNKNPKEITGQMKQVDNLAFDTMTKSQAKQLQKDQAQGGPNKKAKQKGQEPKPELTGKEKKKQLRAEKRAHLQPGYVESQQAKLGNMECEEQMNVTEEFSKQKGITERAKKKGKHNKINKDEAKVNNLLFGNADGSVIEYAGLEETICQHIEMSKLQDSHGKPAEPAEEKKKEEDKPKSEFITLEDLNKPDYYFEYISEMGDQFNEAMDFLSTQPAVGFDTEFTNNTEKGQVATYLQISTLQKGLVINLQNSQFEPGFVKRIAQFCSNKSIKKIGFSIGNDFKALSTTFNHVLEFESFEDLGLMLFTNQSKNNTGIGLSDQCLRLYGKSMDKEAQRTIAYQKELTEEKDMKYAALDALIPLCLYTDLKDFVDITPVDHFRFSKKFGPNDCDFLLDPSCRGVKDLMQRSEFGVRFMDKKSYKEISKICKASDSILVTSDKYQIANSDDFPNVVIFYDTATFKEDFYELTCAELA